MSKTNLMGGIYSKPLLIGNLLHFFTASMALIKLTFKVETNLQLIFSYTIIYSLFTLFFGYVFFTNPSLKQTISISSSFKIIVNCKCEKSKLNHREKGKLK